MKVYKMKKSSLLRIRRQVTVTFTRLVRKATGITEGLAACQCREADKAADLQNDLGPAAILVGHYHVSWVTAIMYIQRKPEEAHISPGD